jgi:predicted Zn-dependent protease
VYRWGKGWRGRSFAAEAERATAAAQWPEAAEKVQAAVQMAPREPAVLRAAAHFYTRIGSPQAYRYWKALLALPGATADERREATGYGLAVQRYDLSEEQLGILRQAEPARAEHLDLAAQLAWRKNDRTAALALTDQLLTLNPGHPGARLRHGQILAASPSDGPKAQGIRELLALGQSDAPTALAALETLANEPALPTDQVRAIAAELATHPGGKTEHRLAAMSLEKRLAPERRAELVERAVENFHSGGPEALAALARWLMQQGEAARVLELIPLPVSLTRQDLFLVRVDALAAQKQWAAIRQILSDVEAPIQPFYREVFLAHATTELGGDRPAKAHWTAALAAASRDPSLLLYLVQYAEKIGALPIAEKAWRQLAQNPNWALRANAALVPLVEAQGNTRGLRDLMRQLRRLAPDDPAPRHDEAYLDLLLGENIRAAQETAAQLLREHPERLAYHGTVALGYLRAGDPAAALRQYDRLEFQWAKAPPSTQAIRAAVLLANEELALAQAAAATVALSALKPEERELISPLRR